VEGITFARVLHVLGVVLWIGSVGFVTTVVLPASKRIEIPEQRVALFESIAGRFAWQARVTTFAVGISGFYITTAWDLSALCERRVLVDARHGVRVGAVHRHSVRRRTSISQSVVQAQRREELRGRVYPHSTTALGTTDYHPSNRARGGERES
jgi:hypothetical protein